MKNLIIYLLNQIQTHSKILLIVVALLYVTGVAHGINMFNAPYYENDEGTYISQAWSLLKEGKVAPYTYWYDHAPLGWILLACWIKLTGGFYTFGTTIDSGRAFMLIIHMLSTLLVFAITRKLTKSIWAGALASIVFSLSPLEIYHQRRVLLDNMMIFWVLTSLWLLMRRTIKVSAAYLSALAFGVAVLTKESALFFLPAFIYALFTQSHQNNKRLVTISWLVIVTGLMSTYFLYAAIKSELLPSDGSPAHVSLLSTLMMQLQRGEYRHFWDPLSDFYQRFLVWFEKDPVLMFIGIGSTIISSILAFKVKVLRIPVIATLFMWLFLLRGKIVLDFYILPLFPFWAINFAILTKLFLEKLSTKKSVVYNFGFAVIMLSLSSFFIIYSPQVQFFDETRPQREAISWIKNNIPEDKHIVIDNSIFTDLREPRFEGDKVFLNAQLSSKIEEDPEIRYEKYGNDWKKFDYLVLSHDTLQSIKQEKLEMTDQVFYNSTIIADWWTPGKNYRDIQNLISTNGAWTSVYKVNIQKQTQR